MFRAIGNAFKDGWNKNEREKSKNEIGEVSIKSLPSMHFGFNEDRLIDDETFEVKSTHDLSKIYSDSINYVSVSSFKTDKDRDNDNHAQLFMRSKWATSLNSKNPETGTTKFENNFKPPVDAIISISKNYKFIYDNAALIIGDYGLPQTGPNGEKNENLPEDDKWLSTEVLELPVVPSMFNPFYGINVVGITGNSPLMNNVDEKSTSVNIEGKEGQVTVNYNRKITEDLSDCSIRKLVELSNQQKLGRSTYKYADFMYCKNLGKYSNNRLITLRKFPIPIGDDIWDVDKGSNDEFWGGVKIPVDVGRLVTWMDDTNKLEDILKYNYKEGWEKREGEYQDVSSQEDTQDRGIVGSIVNLANPTYRKMVGTGFAGGGNKILSAFEGSTNTTFLKASGTNQGTDILTRYDRNRIYEPKGTIRDTHLYTGKLEFSQSFQIVFDYELRAYENINPRTALLDLMNNIQQVTYRTGKFWGGQVWFAGAPGNREGWDTANALIDNTFDKVSDSFSMLLNGDMNFGDWLGSLVNKGANAIKNGAVTVAQKISSGEAKKDAANFIKEYNVGGMIKGMLKNNLGRPALYATNSILTGDPVGLWHLTIGNPRNPIMAIGNLIIEESTIQHYGPLGIDDFPTGLKVTVQLKHAKSRDMVDIGKMYTMGRMGIGVPLSKKLLTDMYKSLDGPGMSETMWSTAFASTTEAISDGVTAKLEEGKDYVLRQKEE